MNPAVLAVHLPFILSRYNPKKDIVHEGHEGTRRKCRFKVNATLNAQHSTLNFKVER
jgi:hypothetical protein